MPFAWNAWALPWIASCTLQGAAAVLVYAVGPRRLLNCALALTLFFGATISAGYALQATSATAADAYAATVLSQAAKFLVGPLYLLFIGAALPSALTAPLRVRGIQVALVVAGAALAAMAVARPAWFIGAPLARPLTPFNWGLTPAAQAYDALAVGIFLFALVASIRAFRRAPYGTPARERAKWFMLAFGLRDVAIAGFLLAAATFLRAGTLAFDLAYHVVFAGLVTLSIVLVLYGVLNWHLFDLDLKIKWTLSRTALAAIFLGVFFVVTQLAQNAFEAQLGWIWGSVAAGLLLFALVPLQRLTERVASAAMPQASGTEEYLAHRRAEVYKGALEEILVDGAISAKERAILDRLRDKLGLAPATASALERDVRAEMGGLSPR